MVYVLLSRCMNAQVALLAEGVDRNYMHRAYRDDRYDVALLAEGVDRNSLLVH